jgi:hypothetical protein
MSPIMTDTVVPASICVPLMVTRVPPSTGPLSGMMPKISGSWGNHGKMFENLGDK